MLSDGAGGHAVMVTDPAHAVAVQGWHLDSLTAQLPHASVANLHLSLAVETMGPDGATAVAHADLPLVMDRTQPVRPAPTPVAPVPATDDAFEFADHTTASVPLAESWETDAHLFGAHADNAPELAPYLAVAAHESAPHDPGVTGPLAPPEPALLAELALLHNAADAFSLPLWRLGRWARGCCSSVGPWRHGSIPPDGGRASGA